MLSKMTRATLTCLLIVTSLVFAYNVDADEKKDDDKKSCIEVEVKLTPDTGGVTGFAQAKSKCSTSYGSMYLYARVARQQPKASHKPYYGTLTRSVKTLVGVNNSSNQASAVAHDYYNNQHVNALVRGNV